MGHFPFEFSKEKSRHVINNHKINGIHLNGKFMVIIYPQVWSMYAVGVCHHISFNEDFFFLFCRYSISTERPHNRSSLRATKQRRQVGRREMCKNNNTVITHAHKLMCPFVPCIYWFLNANEDNASIEVCLRQCGNGLILFFFFFCLCLRWEPIFFIHHICDSCTDAYGNI